MNLITEQHTILNMEGSTQKRILHALTEIAFREGKVNDTDTFFRELCKREQECTTGFEKGIAVPYTRHACMKEVGILFVRTKHKIEWKSVNERSMGATVCLLAPDDRHDFHPKALSRLARRLMHEDLVDILKTTGGQQILSEIIDTIF